jgi:hypothetical protein
MRMIPVYVNGARLELPANAMVLDAVRLWDAGAARDVESGARALTDSRGLPLDPAAPAAAGTIVRVVSARDRDPGAEELH